MKAGDHQHAESIKDKKMRSFVRSDLFRNFMGGFLLGAVGLIAMQPQAETETLKSRVAAVYSPAA